MDQRVLIVDDSPVIRRLFGRAVQMAGVDESAIFQAGNGQEALDLLDKEQIDLVLLDINMPVLDGIGFMEKKVERPDLSAVHVVAVTTEGNKKRIARLEELGVEAFLRKPFEPEELVEVVGKITGEE